jgi:hypothetical protein
MVSFFGEFSLITLTKYSSHSPKRDGEGASICGEVDGSYEGVEKGEEREGKREEKLLEARIFTFEHNHGNLSHHIENQSTRSKEKYFKRKGQKLFEF